MSDSKLSNFSWSWQRFIQYYALHVVDNVDVPWRDVRGVV